MAAVSLAGCHKKQVVEDPYVEATLREATTGEVISDDFLYRIDYPQIVDKLGDILVAKQENITEFFTGDNIAAKVDSLGSLDSLTFRVAKTFSPIVHFEVDNIVSPTDSIVIPQGRPIAFPRTQDAMTFTPPDDYTEVQMGVFKWNDTEGLRAMIGKKYAIQARLSYSEADTAWVLSGYEASAWGQVPKLRIQGYAPGRKEGLRPSLEIVLRMLMATKQDFVGGILYKDIEPWDFRKKNYFCGTAELAYVRYLDKVFTR
ncbi:MAG TPA: hypothetical protein VFH88_03520 [Candidatus Krumholzibacteria bacterium]|nr:hypothetical protein [Candidatus Krumholzibacteria bacterium]